MSTESLTAAFFVDTSIIFIDEDKALAFSEVISGSGFVNEIYNIVEW